MEKDFHYYLTYALAKITGSDWPETVAHSSQFVDDNNEGQFSVDGKDTLQPRPNSAWWWIWSRGIGKARSGKGMRRCAE